MDSVENQDDKSSLHPSLHFLASKVFRYPDRDIIFKSKGCELICYPESRSRSKKNDCLRVMDIQKPDFVETFIRFDLKLLGGTTQTVYKTPNSPIVWLSGFSITQMWTDIKEMTVYVYRVEEGSIPSFNLKLYQDCLAGASGCDTVLNVEGTELRAHRLILASQSEYFEKMFAGPYKEANDGRVEVKDISSKAVEKLLEFLYTGKIKEWDGMEADLIKLCDMYMVDGMKKFMSLRMLHMQGEEALKLFSDLIDSPLLTNDLKDLLMINICNYFCALSEEETLKILSQYVEHPAITRQQRRILIGNFRSMNYTRTTPAWADFVTSHPLLSDAIVALCE